MKECPEVVLQRRQHEKEVADRDAAIEKLSSLVTALNERIETLVRELETTKTTLDEKETECATIPELKRQVRYPPPRLMVVYFWSDCWFFLQAHLFSSFASLTPNCFLFIGKSCGE